MQNNLIPIYDDGAKSVSPEAATMKKIVGILSLSGVARSEDQWEQTATHMAEWISPDSTCNELSLKKVLGRLENATDEEFNRELRLTILE